MDAVYCLMMFTLIFYYILGKGWLVFGVVCGTSSISIFIKILLYPITIVVCASNTQSKYRI